MYDHSEFLLQEDEPAYDKEVVELSTYLEHDLFSGC